MIEIEHCSGYVTHFEAGRVTENQHLYYRWRYQREARPRISQDLDELLYDEAPDSIETFFHSQRLFLKARTANAPTTVANNARPQNWVLFATKPEPLRNTAFRITT
jgi:hypothetical protein